MAVRSDAEINRVVSEYSDMIRRICLCHLKNQADTEDIFQTVFLKYMLHAEEFREPEHEKAWFIRVTVNACKDHLKWLFRHATLPLDALAEEASVEPEYREVLAAVLTLPVRYRDAIYLHYYEGYSAVEIAGILNVRENTVYSILSRGRSMLREKLGGEGWDE